MAMTERVVVMLTTQQKEEISRRAAAERLSLGGYMRRQALANDELLSALLDELAASTAQANASLDRTLANFEESERRWPGIEAAARERAMAEFSALDPTLLAQMIR